MQYSIVQKAMSRQGPAITRFRGLIITCAALIWILGLTFGIQRLQAFEGTPGDTGLTPGEWPGHTPLILDSAQPTLVMFVHPQCSCSRASLSELRDLLRDIGRPVNARVLFVQSDEVPESATWREARTIAGVAVGTDPRGVEAVRFGALTSGHIVAYNTAGALIFSGGITSARGHAGANVGRQQLLHALGTSEHLVSRHAVFGCPLSDDSRTIVQSVGAG